MSDEKGKSAVELISSFLQLVLLLCRFVPATATIGACRGPDFIWTPPRSASEVQRSALSTDIPVDEAGALSGRSIGGVLR
jgi:hypothetical protein